MDDNIVYEYLIFLNKSVFKKFIFSFIAQRNLKLFFLKTKDNFSQRKMSFRISVNKSCFIVS